tara:strand:- start:993 stop:1235 length:243 start_codon:yes stop_codon:yes gene_type:complete
MNTREQLIAMNAGEMKDVVFSNGILKSTKEMFKNSDDEFEVHSMICGWYTALLTLDEAVDYCEGRLSSADIEWKDLDDEE